VACPFFLPKEKLENGSWPHPSRLPLGCGWSGYCAAPGHDGETPSEEELRDFCNLGYAEQCPRLPRERLWDSVRFGARTVVTAGEDPGVRRIQVRYVCERGHLPAEYGFLEFVPSKAQWTNLHPDLRVQRLVECFLASYCERAKSDSVVQAAAS
jgi:hypothetical protein